MLQTRTPDRSSRILVRSGAGPIARASLAIRNQTVLITEAACVVRAVSRLRLLALAVPNQEGSSEPDLLFAGAAEFYRNFGEFQDRLAATPLWRQPVVTALASSTSVREACIAVYIAHLCPFWSLLW